MFFLLLLIGFLKVDLLLFLVLVGHAKTTIAV